MFALLQNYFRIFIDIINAHSFVSKDYIGKFIIGFYSSGKCFLPNGLRDLIGVRRVLIKGKKIAGIFEVLKQCNF